MLARLVPASKVSSMRRNTVTKARKTISSASGVPGCVPNCVLGCDCVTNLSVFGSNGTVRSRGQLSKDKKGKLSYREQTDYTLAHGRTCGRQRRCPAVSLCFKGGAKGHYILQGVREGVLEERKLDVEGLWTQTLLARDELDGWSGLRPYVDDVRSGNVPGSLAEVHK